MASSAQRSSSKVLLPVVIAGGVFGSFLANAQEARLGGPTQQERLAAHLNAECPPPTSDACTIPAARAFFQAETEANRKAAAAASKRADEHKAATAEINKSIAGREKAIAGHQTATEALNTEARCLGIIAEGLTSKRITPDDVRAARAVHPATTDACVLVGRLQPRLGALTKQ